MGLPEQTVESELVLRGRLHDVDLETLLAALRLGRQYLTLELLDDTGALTGSVAVKAGRILWANAGEQTGADAVRALLDSQDAAEFRVWLQPSAAGFGVDASMEPLGSIAELTRLEGAEPVARTHVLQGVLTEHLTAGALLRVVAFTRQHVSLELSDGAGSMLGEVCAKAGKILSAQAGERNELPALQELLHLPAGTRFDLFAEAEGVTQLHPLGGVDDVLRRIATPASAEDPALAAASATSAGRKTAPPPLARAARSGITQSPQARILEGSLEEFELAHVLQVLSTSRQQFELHVRDDDAQTVGAIEVKSGMIIGASAGKLSGLAAARELLAARSGRFVAIRRAVVPGDRKPLASVSGLLQLAAADLGDGDSKRNGLSHSNANGAWTDNPFDDTQALSLSDATVDEGDARDADDAADMPVPIPVLDGKLGDLDVSSILQVAGASRQYTCVHIFDDQRKPIGAIHLKGSHVVSAQAQDVGGIAAVRRLLHSPRDFSFLVQRYPAGPEITTSLGSTASVLQRAAALTTAAAPASAADSSHTARPTPEPRVLKQAAAQSSGLGSNWVAGALVGAGFVLLGGIASAVVLRSPALNTSASPSLNPAPVPAPTPRAAVAAAAPEPANAASSGSTVSAPPPAVEPPQLQPPGPPSRATIASFQAGLRQLGYQTGPIDGVLGPQTTAAIKAFQYAEHLAVDGTLSAPTRAVLLRRISEP